MEIRLRLPAAVSFHDIAVFLHQLEMGLPRPRCANCGQSVNASDPATVGRCGHVFHQECWDLHLKACEIKTKPCLCPHCSAGLDAPRSLAFGN